MVVLGLVVVFGLFDGLEVIQSLDAVLVNFARFALEALGETEHYYYNFKWCTRS